MARFSWVLPVRIYQNWIDGNFTVDEYYDCITTSAINVSSLFNMESRMYKPNISCGDPDEWDEQNDTIYYYTSTFTNITGEELKSRIRGLQGRLIAGRTLFQMFIPGYTPGSITEEE